MRLLNSHMRGPAYTILSAHMKHPLLVQLKLYLLVIIDFFSLLDKVFLVLHRDTVAILDSAALFRRDEMLLTAPLGITNLLLLRLSFFSTIRFIKALGRIFFSHRHTTLDSCICSSSSIFKILCVRSLVRVCSLYLPISFQVFFN